MVLALWRRLRENAPLPEALASLALAFGLSTILCFWILQRIPFDPFSLLADRRQLLFMPLYYVLISIPFFCSGLGLALLFTRGAREIHRLYSFDLFGAGVGCAAIAAVMPVFGGSGSVMVAAAIGLLAAAIFAMDKAHKWAGVCLACHAGLDYLGTARHSTRHAVPDRFAPGFRRSAGARTVVLGCERLLYRHRHS